jgi:hypothetical protein
MVERLMDHIFLASLRRQQRVASQQARQRRRADMKTASEALGMEGGNQGKLNRGLPAIRDEYFWAGFLELGYEWWPALALGFGALLAIAAGGSPWSEIGIAVFGGLTVLLLTTPFMRWRDNAIKSEIWEAARALGEHLGVDQDEVMDAVENLLVEHDSEDGVG